ncbi:MAG: hypothetical protein KKE50_00080 [Nanoarchaeota archaeon]|nr:hypothetical protein [Nanoarchaeota archaeon]
MKKTLVGLFLAGVLGIGGCMGDINDKREGLLREKYMLSRMVDAQEGKTSYYTEPKNLDELDAWNQDYERRKQEERNKELMFPERWRKLNDPLPPLKKPWERDDKYPLRRY